MSLWDGRFSGGPGEEMRVFSESLGTDLQMWREDIAGSVAHARMLGEVGLVTPAEAETLVEGLEQVAGELAGGWTPGIEHEDIHMAVESRLAELVGPVAGKLHTARSRNDQVATDVRLWLKARLQALDGEVSALIAALLDRVESDGRTLVPGYTHLQRAQPIWLGHHLLAHAWALSRDRERIAGALERTDRSPLGAAAMAGTPHPIDRARTAELLGFSGLVDNAMDAVSARDHLIESVSVCALISTHLSRIAQELVLWSSTEFGRIRLGEAWSTGSSIMPQKRNPDAAELVRGRTGRVVGSLVSLLTLVKALPLAYNRDLQEDREALFDALETTLACTRVSRGCIESLEVCEPPRLDGDPLLATELADYLATRGVPFREAHRVVGQLVRRSEEEGRRLDTWSPEELTAMHPVLGAEALEWLEPVRAVERRTSHGGTAWSEVERQVVLLRGTLTP
ncbi:MAG: argininosuccinate lyase [Myxococcota bacterium]|nr:argininosuccinate lyase [Myxococcota bacterium]